MNKVFRSNCKEAVTIAETVYIDGRVRDVLLWNVWDQVPSARDLVAQPGPFKAEDLNAIKAPGWKIVY